MRDRYITEIRVQFSNFEEHDVTRTRVFGFIKRRHPEKQRRGEKTVLEEFCNDMKELVAEIEEILDD